MNPQALQHLKLLQTAISKRALGIQALVEAAIGPPLNDVMLWLPMTMQAWKDG